MIERAWKQNLGQILYQLDPSQEATEISSDYKKENIYGF